MAKKKLPEDGKRSPIKASWSKRLMIKLRKTHAKTVPVEEADHHQIHSEPILQQAADHNKNKMMKKKKKMKTIPKSTPQHEEASEGVQDIICEVEENTVHPSTPRNQPPTNHTVSAPSPPIESSPKLKKQVTDVGKRSESRRQMSTKCGIAVEKIEPIVGMSIISVTLVIMLVWGMVCAIVCTCAWCYLIPLLQTTTTTSSSSRSSSSTSNSSSSRGAKVILPNSRVESDTNLNLEAYKKRVVLEGFLQRTHKSP